MKVFTKLNKLLPAEKVWKWIEITWFYWLEKIYEQSKELKQNSLTEIKRVTVLCYCEGCVRWYGLTQLKPHAHLENGD